MAPEVFVLPVKNREFQRVDDTAYSVDDAPCQKPSECRRRQGVQDLCECQHAGPAHADIQDRRYPLGTVYPERLQDNAQNGDAPNNGEQDNAGPVLEDQEADGRVAACYENKDHHVIYFFQDGVHFFGTVECVVCGAGRIEKDQAHRVDRYRDHINSAGFVHSLDKKRNCRKNGHQHADEVCDRTSRIFYMCLNYLCHNHTS